jgi:methyltransferase
MHSGLLLLLYLALQRSIELVIARRNTEALLRKGAYEAGTQHYPAVVGLHASWLATLWIFGWDHDLQPAWFVAFVGLQAARLWVLRTLGERWTTRIIVLPAATPVTSGPYRFVRHPNYLVVACELPCASLAVGLTGHAVIFGVLNFALLAWRIRCEDAAFAGVVEPAPR